MEGGYPDTIFLCKNKDFLCPICLKYFKDPVTCCNGQHIFCSSCITHWLRREKACPLDRNRLKWENLVPDQPLREKIMSNMVKCESCCGWEGKLSGWEEHELECPEKIIVCGLKMKANFKDVLLTKYTDERWIGDKNELHNLVSNYADVNDIALDDDIGLSVSDHIYRIWRYTKRTCSWQGCGQAIHEHKLNDCPNRQITCEDCGDEHYAKFKDLHSIFCSIRNATSINVSGNHLQAMKLYGGIYEPRANGAGGWPVFEKRTNNNFVIEHRNGEWQLKDSCDLGSGRCFAWKSSHDRPIHHGEGSTEWVHLFDGRRVDDGKHLEVVLMTASDKERILNAQPVVLLESAQTEALVAAAGTALLGTYSPTEMLYYGHPIYTLEDCDDVELYFKTVRYGRGCWCIDKCGKTVVMSEESDSESFAPQSVVTWLQCNGVENADSGGEEDSYEYSDNDNNDDDNYDDEDEMEGDDVGFDDEDAVDDQETAEGFEGEQDSFIDNESSEVIDNEDSNSQNEVNVVVEEDDDEEEEEEELDFDDVRYPKRRRRER